MLLRATQEAVDKEKVAAKKVAAPTEEVKEEVKDDKESRGLRQRRAKQRVVFRRCYYKKLVGGSGFLSRQMARETDEVACPVDRTP